ncbi:S49 family peptidase [Tardiphaga sp. vice304]|uniref:S49 family peptidase n=1 Tax=Tardiphaga sp. vice304 TaxID=2592817 RepID=UPI0011657ABB|nr:S49 family peptidase [Tardiphaga sp. vice304]QDM26991.1 S49 family peptidase [Tardiphaga sp. vice304]
MMDPGKAAAIMMGIGGRIVDGGIDLSGAAPMDHVAFEGGRLLDSMGRLGDPLTKALQSRGAEDDDLLYRMENVAVIPIEGTLVHKGKYLGSYSGSTSYEGLQTRIAAAARSNSVRGVVLEVDSFGGDSAGAYDVAEAIYELSQVKPTLAILTDFALSAGYLLASAARQIVMPENGSAGNIGVITMHVDYSKQLEKAGVKVTVLSSGKLKADGNPFSALPDDTASRIQARLDAGRDQFATAVARYRGVRLGKDAALATEAESYRGMDAVTAGIADGVMRPSDAFAQFVSLMR